MAKNKPAVPLDANAKKGKYIAFAAKVKKTIMWDNVLFLVTQKAVLLKTIATWLGWSLQGVLTTTFARIEGYLGTMYAPYGAGQFRMTYSTTFFGDRESIFTLKSFSKQKLPRSTDVPLFPTVKNIGKDIYSPDMKSIGFFYVEGSTPTQIWSERFSHDPATGKYSSPDAQVHPFSTYQLGSGTLNSIYYLSLGDGMVVTSTYPNSNPSTPLDGLFAIAGKAMLLPSKGGEVGVNTAVTDLPNGFYKSSFLVWYSYEDGPLSYVSKIVHNVMSSKSEHFTGDALVRIKPIGCGTTPFDMSEMIYAYTVYYTIPGLPLYLQGANTNAGFSAIPFAFPMAIQSKVLTVDGEEEFIDSIGSVIQSVSTQVSAQNAVLMNVFTDVYQRQYGAAVPTLTFTDIAETVPQTRAIVGVAKDGSPLLMAVVGYGTADILGYYEGSSEQESVATVRHKYYSRLYLGPPGSMQLIKSVYGVSPQETVHYVGSYFEGFAYSPPYYSFDVTLKFLGCGEKGSFFSFSAPTPSWVTGGYTGIVCSDGTMYDGFSASRETHDGIFGSLQGVPTHLSFDTGGTTTISYTPFGRAVCGKEFTFFLPIGMSSEESEDERSVWLWSGNKLVRFLIEPSPYEGHPELAYSFPLVLDDVFLYMEYTPSSSSKVITRAKYNGITGEVVYTHVRGSWHTDENGVVGTDESWTSAVGIDRYDPEPFTWYRRRTALPTSQ